MPQWQGVVDHHTIPYLTQNDPKNAPGGKVVSKQMFTIVVIVSSLLVLPCLAPTVFAEDKGAPVPDGITLPNGTPAVVVQISGMDQRVRIFAPSIGYPWTTGWTGDLLQVMAFTYPSTDDAWEGACDKANYYAQAGPYPVMTNDVPFYGDCSVMLHN